MSIWKEIKRAMNSTLGTSNFKPLDQIITESKGLAASDNPYYSLGSYSVRNGTTTLLTATMNVNGTVRVKGTSSGFSSSETVTLRIYKNSSETQTITWRGDQTQYADVAFSANDVLRIDVVATSTTGHTLAVGLYATPTDMSGITVT